jgi:hypothetical protein
MVRMIQFRVFTFGGVVGMIFAMLAPSQVEASCGPVSCFVVIGSQQQVPMKGLLTINAIYNFTLMEAPPGEGGRIPFANQGDRTITPVPYSGRGLDDVRAML